MSGCDYSIWIKGIGIFKALELIKNHKDIHNVLISINSKSKPLTICSEEIKEEENYKDDDINEHDIARYLFQNPDITNPHEIELEWKSPDYKKLTVFLCEEKNFNLDRIEGVLNCLKLSNNNLQRSISSKLIINIGATSLCTNNPGKRRQDNKVESKIKSKKLKLK